MADTHEADRPGLTADAVRDLFASLPVPGRDVVWLADQILAVAQHVGSFALEWETPDRRAVVCRAGSTESVLSGTAPARLLRPLLARFAVLGADEVGGEPQFAGGRYSLTRSSRTGPVRLEIAFANTPDRQHIRLTRVPITARPRADAPTDDAGTPHQPSA